jgi:hypothetical protein
VDRSEIFGYVQAWARHTNARGHSLLYEMEAESGAIMEGNENTAFASAAEKQNRLSISIAQA